MTVDQAQVAAEATVWVASFTQASAALKDNTATAVQTAWQAFEDWYDVAAVTALATEMANVSTTAQQTTAGLSAQFATEVAAAALGARAPQIRKNLWTPVRNGAPLSLVHSRPAEVFKKAIATGATHAEALQRAGARGAGLAVSELSLEDRVVQLAVYERMGVEAYRRVIRPELSKTGTCGLCIVAADRIYFTSQLMPLHPPSCKCITMPIVGEIDPGESLNREDLDQLYAEAGSNKADDLRKTRYQVNEHGELGPMLTRAGDEFRSAAKVPLEADPERAGRMLAKVEPVLIDLERRAASGENVSDPLAYQRDLIDRLRSIVTTAA